MLILFYSFLLAGGLNTTALAAASAGVIVEQAVEPAPSATAPFSGFIDLSALDQQHNIQLNVAEFVSFFWLLILAVLR